jgi:hypothetical protein
VSVGDDSVVAVGRGVLVAVEVGVGVEVGVAEGVRVAVSGTIRITAGAVKVAVGANEAVSGGGAKRSPAIKKIPTRISRSSIASPIKSRFLV